MIISGRQQQDTVKWEKVQQGVCPGLCPTDPADGTHRGFTISETNSIMAQLNITLIIQIKLGNSMSKLYWLG